MVLDIQGEIISAGVTGWSKKMDITILAKTGGQIKIKLDREALSGILRQLGIEEGGDPFKAIDKINRKQILIHV